MNKKILLLGLGLLFLAVFLSTPLWFGRDEMKTSDRQNSAKSPVAIAIRSGEPVMAKKSIPAQEAVATINEGADMAVEMAASLAGKNMLFSQNSFSMTIAVKNALKLNPEQAKLIEELTKKVAYDVASALVNEAKLVKTPKGDAFFTISKLEASDQLKNYFSSQIATVAGAEKGKLIAALAANTSMFAQFGENPLEIYISDETNPDGLKQTYITTEIVDSVKGRMRFYTLATDQMKNPIYELLIKKLQGEINE